ncbi:hypothetical protein QW131_11470 [Roseibium salinum]|nr:hypothetical protein [Roseibium salinum]
MDISELAGTPEIRRFRVLGDRMICRAPVRKPLGYHVFAIVRARVGMIAWDKFVAKQYGSWTAALSAAGSGMVLPECSKENSY